MLTDPLLAFGTLVAFAILLGFVGDRLRLPRVTSYLVAGVIVGPSVLGLIGRSELEHFDPVANLAMALVLFNLGSHFTVPLLKKIGSHILPVAVGDLVVTSGCVAGGLWIIVQSSTSGLGTAAALLLGCLAMATAPATTVLVLKEMRSEGEVTESAQALVAINNLTTIIVFELLMLAFASFGNEGGMGFGDELAAFAWTFFGSVSLGIMLGLAMSFAAGFLSTMQWIAVLLAASMVGLGLCDTFPMSYMLAFLVAGFIFANTSQEKETDLAESEKLTTLLCVAFFAIHGAELELDKFLQIGFIGVAYIVLRVTGKYLGIRLGASWSRESREMRQWLGAAMLSQAGAAIALSAVAVDHNPVAFAPVQTIILGTVIVFEILGPLLIRMSVVNSGEVPIAHVTRHSNLSFADQLRTMWWKLTSFGSDPALAHAAADITVASLARSRVAGIPQDAQFDEIIAHIEHSHDNTFPVVNDQNQVVGIIRYPLLSESLFDPLVSKLVRAEDIATAVEKVVYGDEPASVVFDFFRSSSDDCLPIISRDESRRMEGVVRRADLRTFLIRKRQKGSSGH